jgi:Uncharacterized conserved protein
MKNNVYITLAAALISVSVFADTVSGVTASQHWPWDGKVDITYTLTATTQKTTPVFAVSFQGKIGDGEAFDLTSLEGDGSTGITLGAGEKRVIWDSTAESTTSTGVKTDSLQIAVTAEDVTDDANYLKLDLSTYKMTYSPSITINDAAKTTELWLRRVENGTFTMGSPTTELGRQSNETQHQVTLTKAFYIGVFECTQKQYETVTGSNPSAYTGDARPVEKVKYNDLRGTTYGATWPTKTGHRVDSTSFFGQLRAMTGNGLTFDLPTEAQWEFACRAGTTTAWNNGTDITDTTTDLELNTLGRYKNNQTDGKGGYSQHTTVGSYLPNAWGLYDMHGNVSEWCLDWYVADITSYTTDPTGPDTGTYRLLRGGSWYSYAKNCRSAYRDYFKPGLRDVNYYGFRIVLVQ